MKLKEINDWWTRSIKKERARMTNSPKPVKGDRFGAPEDFSHFAPPLKQFKKTNAR